MGAMWPESGTLTTRLPLIFADISSWRDGGLHESSRPLSSSVGHSIWLSTVFASGRPSSASLLMPEDLWSLALDHPHDLLD